MLAIMGEERPIAEAAHREGVEPTFLAKWCDQFSEGGPTALVTPTRHLSSCEAFLEAAIDTGLNLERDYRSSHDLQPV